ncbi:FtsX-like permease family protein [Streptomyces sp. NPDC006530]|uniref:FtsX-like permease family protein n=1 Tax=Streptomyces sp. NPDC006530 TaxID=3364750 RepID=UPI00369AD6FD
MFHLALRTLGFRKGGFLASFIALFFGALILAACGGLMETGVRADVPPQRFAAAPVVVARGQSYDGDLVLAYDRLDASLVARIAAAPGVRRALGDVSFPATALDEGRGTDPGAELGGHGWSSAVLAGAPLAQGTEPRAAGQAALDTRLATRLGVGVGDRLRMMVSGASVSVRVSGLVRPATGTDTALYVTDAQAEQLRGAPGRVDAITVLPQPAVSAEELKRNLAPVLRGLDATAVTGEARGTVEFPDSEGGASPLISMSAVFGGIAAMVAVFVVGSTLAVLIQQRMREMALLRAIGALPGQIRRMVVGETLVVGFGATLLALVPGRAAGELMMRQLAAAGVVDDAIVYRAGWIPLATAAGTALLAAVAAAFIASRRAALAPPTAALTESALGSRWLSAPRLVCALLCFGGAAALAFVTATVMDGSVASSTAGPAAMLWTGGVALIAPGLTRVLLAVLRPPLRLLPGLAGRLASDNARARRIRTAGAVTPVVLATGLATALIYLQLSADAGGGGEATSAWINYLLAGTIIGYAVISLVNTLVVAAAERRAEFALQRLVGATPGQVLRMVTVEALLVAVMGIALGSFVALATLVPFSLALDGSWLPGGGLVVYGAIVGCVAALTLLATLLPARLALRIRPAEVLAMP